MQTRKITKKTWVVFQVKFQDFEIENQGKYNSVKY